MSVIDEVFKANEEHYRHFTQGLLPPHPSRKLAVLTCMDARLDPAAMLGLQPGEAHVLRNAGAIVTEDVLRSLLVSHYVTDTQAFVIIGHTECGMTSFRDEDLRARLRRTTGAAAVAPSAFHAFSDVEDSVHEQMQKLRSHPWVPKGVEVRGFVYDVRTGRMNEVAGR